MDKPSKEEREAADLIAQSLLARIAQGEVPAFQEFYRNYSGLIFSTIYRVLNDQEDTEDVAQELFVKLWQKAGLYDPSKGRPLTWITTLARNRAIDRIRSKQRRFKLRDGFKDESAVLSQTRAVDEGSSKLLDFEERREILVREVSKLSEKTQRAIQLAYFDGLTQSEVADRLGEPLGTVKARIRRGVSRLRTRMPHLV